ncbi:MAG TPA: hypothetical protein VIL99_03940, partial [Ignavibacteria bacterium]
FSVFLYTSLLILNFHTVSVKVGRPYENKKITPSFTTGMAKTPLFGLEIPMLYIGTLAKITLKIFYVIIQSLSKWGRPCENKKITPSFTTGMAKTPLIRL